MDKTLARVHQRIENQEFYEAHQAVRTVVARYARTRDYASAVALLYSSSLLLARARQTGSASDLVLYLLKIYEDAGVKPDGSSRGRLAEVLWNLEYEPGVVKQLAQRTMAWSHHDHELAHVFGTIFLRASDIYEAEKYLLQGSRDSAALLARAHAHWSESINDPGFSAVIFSRGVLGYLSSGNLRNAITYWETANIKPDNQITEFLDLLIKTCQTKDAALYRKLSANYKPAEAVPAWQPLLTRIELDFFQIVPSKKYNFMDMMGGLMK